MDDDVDGEEDEYWIVRIPKPRRLMRAVGRLFGGVGQGVLKKTITVDVPFTIITSALIGVLMFVFFTAVVKIPDLVAALFTAILLGFYLYVLRSETRR
ncbi:MAG: hypothetical protein QXX49_07390 [Candidatus Caldarchaeum sp.]|uniref:Uncharacterized protein n=1 Tax=Caldiarchaeum subterraneum TaxID=311458 RepID=A0A7J3VUP9_CALS0